MFLEMRPTEQVKQHDVNTQLYLSALHLYPGLN